MKAPLYKISLLKLLIIFSFFILSSHASNYYSDPATGSMSNAGSAANPWASLSAVFAANKTFVAGDTIFLKTGNHGYAVVKGSNTGFVVITPAFGQTPILTRLRVGNGTTQTDYWKIHKLKIQSTSTSVGTTMGVSLVEIYGLSSHVTISGCAISSTSNTTNWGRSEWRDSCNSGLSTRANLNTNHIIENNTITNVAFGIQISSSKTIVRGNTVQNFTHDASRILGSNIIFEKNKLLDLIKVMAYTENHDDLLQAFTTATPSIGTDTLKNDTIRQNIFINTTDTTRTFRGSAQGLGCFDGPLLNWSVENNIVMTDNWHGISLYGATNCKVINNTVLDPYPYTPFDPVDLNSTNTGPAWISINEKTAVIASNNNIVKNNLVANTVTIGSPTMGTATNNIVVGAMSNYTTYFKDVSNLELPGNFDLHLNAGCPAVDAGISATSLKSDFDDTPRPQGAGYDVGAYEYKNSELLATSSGGGTGSYSTLKAAFDDVNNGKLTGAVTIQIKASCIETVSAVLKASGTITAGGTSNYTSIKIYPTLANLSISGSIASGNLIDLQGADNLTIDGRMYIGGIPAADTKSLTIENSASLAAVSINLGVHAEYNSVKFCIIKGSSTTSKGVVNFQAPSTNGNGNSHNSISNNTITGNSVGKPYYGLVSTGFAGSPSSSDTIQANEFPQILQAGVPSSAICLSGAFNDSWKISGNNIYDSSSSFAPTSTSAYYAINILGGFGYEINDNYIGGQTSLCGGNPLTKTNANNNVFAGIYMKTAAAGTVSSIQNNTIKNFHWENNNTGQWYGIMIDAGSITDFNIGNTIGNTIGDNSTTGSIFYTAGATGGNLYGIYVATSGATTCQNNKIGSLIGNNSRTGTGGTTSITAIFKSATGGSTNISNNIIGSPTTPNSILATKAIASQNIYGINCAGTATINIISNNTIANLKDSTTTGTIYAISLTGGKTTVNSNLIHSLFTTMASIGAIVMGISLGPTVSSTCSNNIILLGGNNPTTIYGFNEAATAIANNIYYNTVYIDGVPTSKTLKSYNLYSAGTGATNVRNFKNNIFFNNRQNAGATGNNYTIGLAAFGTGALVCNYNNLYVPTGTYNYVGIYNTTNKRALIDWQGTVISGITLDANSKSDNPSFTVSGGITASDYYSNATLTGFDLSSTINTDFSGATRTNMPKMGALENVLINESTTSITGLNYNLNVSAGPSLAQSFTVSGSSLLNNIFFSAPTDFEISLDPILDYSTVLSLSPIFGILSATTIYVRLISNKSLNNYSGNINIVSIGTSPQTVSLTGFVNDVTTDFADVSSPLNVFVNNGNIKVSGVKAGELIQVYNDLGQKVRTLIAQATENEFHVQNKGVLIIKIRAKSTKIIL